MTTHGYYSPPGGRVERATGTTDANGNVTFTWPAGAFAVAPVVTLGMEGTAGFRSARITANSAASTTVHVLQAAGVTLLGIGVLAAGVNAPGVVVHAHAAAP
ncbi:hypothetical protein PV410_12885 [Streptomyces sp. PA03-5A]|nr:hypothetical protein [Streptomyces sp. PA03-5A]